MIPSGVPVPATAWTARWTMPSPPQTTSASTPSVTHCWARSSASSASRPWRLRTTSPPSRSLASARLRTRPPLPLPAVGLVRRAISLLGTGADYRAAALRFGHKPQSAATGLPRIGAKPQTGPTASVSAPDPEPDGVAPGTGAHGPRQPSHGLDDGLGLE